MADNYKINFYAGADYGLDPDYGNPIAPYVPLSSLGMTTNAQTANQINAVSQSLATGAKTVEVQMTFPQVEKAIPNQHLDEINRLKKLTGAELTLHGPMIEPTGFNPQQGGWNEIQRQQAENQIWTAIERGHRLDPSGNLVVTLHSSATLPDPETKYITPEGKEVNASLFVIDERTGQAGNLPKPKKDYLFGEEASTKKELERINKERWIQRLSQASVLSDRSKQAISEVGTVLSGQEKEELKDKSADEIYKLSKSAEGKKFFESLNPGAKKVADLIIERMYYSEINNRDAYNTLHEMYNEAYYLADKKKDNDSINKLKEFKEKVGPLLEEYNKDKTKVYELNNAVKEGIQLFDSIEPPQSLQPIREFGIEKSAETFANVAFKGYKKFGDTAPVISIENPPVGTGFSRAEEIEEIIKETRKKFVEKAMKESSLSKSEAEEQAEKLIGATWDVGHINMLRQYGYGDKELKEQTKRIAPYIKHIHLSDNFGMDHSELPMGMGNVPIKEHEKLIKKYGKQLDKIKRVIETGDWYQHFQAPPFSEVASAYGSALYPMKGGYWNQFAGATGGYFVGQGTILPDVNFQTYGTGFSNLPVELGGQMTGRNRLSGSPTE